MKLSDLLQNRNRLFWVLNTAGWLGYVVAAYLGALAHEKPDSYIAVILVTAVAGFALTIPMRYAYHWLWRRPAWIVAAGTIAISYALALLWKWFSNSLYYEWVKGGWQPEDFTSYISGVLGSFYILLCWSGIYFGSKYQHQVQLEKERTLAATAAAHQAQLKMLRYQLNPHFLFNTLNAISTLILDRKNEVANQAVTRLSDFLRYTLDNDPMKRVTLRQELEALDLYLGIEEVRFGDRLTVHREIESQALDALVPSLILQPLIENAIKYAITPREDGGTIRIVAKVHHGDVALTVADDGPGLGNGRSNGKSSGVGLRNTRERLRQLYGQRQAFTLAPNVPHGLVITINIPFQNDE